jgi:hypothetical protein
MPKRKVTEAELLTALGMAPYKPVPPKRKKRVMPEAFPDYGKSLVSQGRGDPHAAGLLRGTGAGLASAVLAALASRMATEDSKKIMLASLLGGLAGGGAGYLSGKKERESENTRLLALRRLGIETPGEFDIASRYPLLAQRVTTKGERV